MISPRRLLPLPLLVLALAGVGCGDETTAKDVEGTTTEQTTTDGTTTAADGTTATEDTTATTATETSGGPATPISKIVSEVGKDTSTAPKVPVTSGEQPSTFAKRDVVVGKGRAAKLNDDIQVRYTLALWAGDKVESSWDSGKEPAKFPLTEGGLIPGWIKGIPGMKPGGRRILVVPSDDGYGDAGSGNGGIPGGATLVFVVDLVKAS